AEERALAVGLPARDARVESGRLVDEGEGGGVGGIRRQALGAHRRRIRRGERRGQAIAAAGLARRHAREREPLEEPAERGREARDEAARGEQLLDRAGLGAKRSGPACAAACTRTSRYSATSACRESPPGRSPAASPAVCAAPSSSAGQGRRAAPARQRSVAPSKPSIASTTRAGPRWRR